MIGISNLLSAPSAMKLKKELLVFLWKGGSNGLGQGVIYVHGIKIVNYVLQIFKILTFCLETVFTLFFSLGFWQQVGSGNFVVPYCMAQV